MTPEEKSFEGNGMLYLYEGVCHVIKVIQPVIYIPANGIGCGTAYQFLCGYPN
jgi:hypothetical protein